MTARRAAAVAGLALLGGLLAGWPGALLAAALVAGTARAPGLALATTAALLVVTAAATLVEEPLGPAKATVADFPLRHDVAASAGRLAGVALLVAVALLAARRPSHRPTPVAWRRRDWRGDLPGLALALGAAAVTLTWAGQGTTPVAGAALALVAAAVAVGGRRWRA